MVDRRPIALVILDGWGIAPPSRGNAILLARTPNMDQLMHEYRTLALQASGESVGLPWHEMGNSEVGHLAIGSGKVIFQNMPRINRAITDGSFFTNPAFAEAIRHVRSTNGTLHLIGLASPGGVHSSIDHLFALLEMTKREKVSSIAVHAILDGRDTPRDQAKESIPTLMERIAEHGSAHLATLSGRFYAMDRDNRWDRTEKAYQAITDGDGVQASDPVAALSASYAQGVYDEEFLPTVFPRDGAPIRINDGDAVISFNFRPDRARQLTKALVLESFEGFFRPRTIKDLTMVTMTEYEKSLPVQVAFPPQTVDEPFAKVLSDNGLTQLHIAETEKYAHVTFFFNGGAEAPFPGEDRVLIPSPQVSLYDQKPRMSAHEIAERLITEIGNRSYDFYLANFANADMVAHTGNLKATIEGIEFVDGLIGRIAEAMLRVDGDLIITADHGNAEEMINLHTGEILKEHTDNPIPIVFVGRRFRNSVAASMLFRRDVSHLTPSGFATDISVTMLGLLGLPVPADMTGKDLLTGMAGGSTI